MDRQRVELGAERQDPEGNREASRARTSGLGGLTVPERGSAQMSRESVMQRTLRRLDTAPDDPIELLRQGDPHIFRKYAAEFAAAEGVRLIGHPTLVEDAISRRVPVVEALVREWLLALAPPRRGRPKNGLTSDLVLTAALYRFWTSGTMKDAARHAAAFLGEPASVSKIEKAEKRYRRDMAILSSEFLRGASVAKRHLFTAELVVLVLQEIEIAANELALQQQTAASARKAARHASFIGAPAATNVVSPQRGDDR